MVLAPFVEETRNVLLLSEVESCWVDRAVFICPRFFSSQLEAEAVNKYRAKEEQLIGSHVTVTKVIVAAHGKLVNLVTRS